MTQTDRYILEILDEGGIIVTPAVIWLNLRSRYGDGAPSKRQISRRLRNELSGHGLVNQPFPDEARGYYKLTELGERFLHDSGAEPEEFIAATDTSEK